MRLINTQTHQLESFEDWDTVPPYAILSHTWEQGEVLFDDISNGSGKEKPGWEKILGACKEAEKLGLFYVWVDTCCIFKESSAELSESLNSMFTWYRGARICFTYMGDMSIRSLYAPAFEDSKWWSRGWTLQELIAPMEIMFFGYNWEFFKLRSSSAMEIESITGVPKDVLGGDLTKLNKYSVATKLSWAARRKTTRGEDKAYSLMGLFGVQMPLLYGEGEQVALFRLQKEIFAVYADHSIFAWQYGNRPEVETHDLLAPSLSLFERRRMIACKPYDWDKIGQPKLSNTNENPVAKYSVISHGIRVQLLLENIDSVHYLAHLACQFHDTISSMLTIKLVLNKGTGQYRRVSANELGEIRTDNYGERKVSLEDVYVAQPVFNFALLRPVRFQEDPKISRFGDYIWLMMDGAPKAFTSVSYSTPEEEWTTMDFGGTPARLQRWYKDKDSAIVFCTKQTGKSFAVIIGRNNREYGEPQRMWVGVLDDVGPNTSAAMVLDGFSEDQNPLTDSSTQMVVKHLKSGGHVVLSSHVTRFQVFQLWIVVMKEKEYVNSRWWI